MPVLVGAVVADVALARSGTVPASVPRVAALLVAVTFALDMVVLELRWGLAWPPEFVAGSVTLAAMAAYAVGWLSTLPAGADQPGNHAAWETLRG